MRRTDSSVDINAPTPTVLAILPLVHPSDENPDAAGCCEGGLRKISDGLGQGTDRSVCAARTQII